MKNYGETRNQEVVMPAEFQRYDLLLTYNLHYLWGESERNATHRVNVPESSELSFRCF